jgi:hypothetical protein
MIAGYWLSMFGMVVNAYLHFNTMEDLTPDRVTLLSLLEKAQIEVVENASMCWQRQNQFAGFTLSNPTTQVITVIICTDAIRKHFPNKVRSAIEVNRTVDHEALHAAQFCKHDYHPGSVADDWTVDNEEEALYYEDKPMQVGEKLIEFCF